MEKKWVAWDVYTVEKREGSHLGRLHCKVDAREEGRGPHKIPRREADHSGCLRFGAEGRKKWITRIVCVVVRLWRGEPMGRAASSYTKKIRT